MDKLDDESWVSTIDNGQAVGHKMMHTISPKYKPITLLPREVDLKVKLLHPDAVMPSYETEGSAGMDLYAVEDGMVYHGKVTMVPTGISLAIPQGYEVQIRPRSGLAAKYGVMVVNTPGTIDSDYRGEIKVLLTQISGYMPFKRGDRIAQMVVTPVSYATMIEVDELDETDRGDGGFGSTGV